MFITLGYVLCSPDHESVIGQFQFTFTVDLNLVYFSSKNFIVSSVSGVF